MNYQDYFYLSSTIATIVFSIIALIFLIKKIVPRKSYYRIDNYEWEHVTNSISSTSYKIDRIQKDIEHIRENLKIEKLKEDNE